MRVLFHLRPQPPGAAPVDVLGKLVHFLQRQAKGFAQVADGAFDLVGGDGPGQGRPAPAPLAVRPQDEVFPDERGKSRSMSGTQPKASSGRKRSSDSLYLRGSMCDRPMR